MAIRDTFTAPGKQTADSLRRAIANAFTSIVTQINNERRPTSGSVLPTVTSRTPPVVGDTFYLDTIDGANAVGFYGFNGTSWERLSN